MTRDARSPAHSAGGSAICRDGDEVMNRDGVGGAAAGVGSLGEASLEGRPEGRLRPDVLADEAIPGASVGVASAEDEASGVSLVGEQLEVRPALVEDVADLDEGRQLGGHALGDAAADNDGGEAEGHVLVVGAEAAGAHLDDDLRGVPIDGHAGSGPAEGVEERRAHVALVVALQA